MNLRSCKPLALIALFAVMCAQVFGMTKGYVCTCHGDEIVTSAKYCHSHSETDSQHTGDACNTNRCPDTDHRSEHKPKKEDLQASSMTRAPEAPQVMLAVIPDGYIFEMITPPCALPPVVQVDHSPSSNVSPPASLLVADCLVMLI